MTKELFNSKHHIQALVSSFSVSAAYKITTDSDSRKVKYDKTNPIVLPIGENSKKDVKLVLNLFQYMTKRTHLSDVLWAADVLTVS